MYYVIGHKEKEDTYVLVDKPVYSYKEAADLVFEKTVDDRENVWHYFILSDFI